MEFTIELIKYFGGMEYEMNQYYLKGQNLHSWVFRFKTFHVEIHEKPSKSRWKFEVIQDHKIKMSKVIRNIEESIECLDEFIELEMGGK